MVPCLSHVSPVFCETDRGQARVLYSIIYELYRLLTF